MRKIDVFFFPCQVSQSYKKVRILMNSGICLSCVPISWRNMMSVSMKQIKCFSMKFH